MTRTELESWLNHLLKEPASRGKIHVANIHGSMELIEKKDLVSFFTKCLAATSPSEAMDLFESVCQVKNGITEHHFGLKIVDMAKADPTEKFATVVKTDTFHKRHLSKPPPRPPCNRATAEPNPA